jgi:hypothetical protein
MLSGSTALGQPLADYGTKHAWSLGVAGGFEGKVSLDARAACDFATAGAG